MKTTLLQKLINELRCPSCFCQMTPPLLRGPSGHTYCRGCLEKQWYVPLPPIGRTRNYSFEKLCFDVTLKCSFASAGCDFMAIGIRVASHEKFCGFSRKSCPLKMTLNCDWVGIKNDFKQHCDLAHPCNFVENHRGYWSTDYSFGFYIGMIFTHETLFRFTVEFCAKSLKAYFSVVYLGEPFTYNRFTFVLKLIYGITEDSCVFRRKCLHISLNPKPFRRNNEISVPLAILKEFSVDSENLLFQIDIIKNDFAAPKEDTTIVRERFGQSVEEAIIAELECPICYSCISPPMLGCVNGHHFCNNCFGKVPHCPLCRDEKSLASNVIMEKLHSFVNVPCRNAVSGCIFHGKGSTLVQHERSCTFPPKG